MDALLTKLQRKRPSARQVFITLFLVCLAGIVSPMLLWTLAEIFHLNVGIGESIFLLTFMFSTALSIPCGILAAILTGKERHPPQ